jgi:TIR domain
MESSRGPQNSGGEIPLKTTELHTAEPMPGQIAGHAFISYTREDKDEVDRLQRTLDAAGIPIWRDIRDLQPGQDWKLTIGRAISDDALAFVACFSAASVGKLKSYQNDELRLAIDQFRQMPPGHLWLIPVRFDDCDIPDFDLGGGRTLASIQRADLFGETRADHTARLVRTILQILGRTPVTAAQDGPDDGDESPSRELPLTPAQRLAKAIHRELEQERKNLKLEAPRPLPIGWKPVPDASPALAGAAADRDVANVYGEIRSRRLVILGPPGSGKSVLVQRLALDILGKHPERKSYREPEDKDRPTLDEQIPVIFGLHSWEPGAELDQWLTSQLTGLSYVPLPTKDLAGQLVRSRRILPIFDGFDEITPALRAEFLDLLNNESSRPLILTSRPEEYWDSRSGTVSDDSNYTVLSDAEVIELTALSLDEVGAYFRDLPRRRNPPARASTPLGQPLVPAWEPVVAALLGHTPPDQGNETIASLREALTLLIQMGRGDAVRLN